MKIWKNTNAVNADMNGIREAIKSPLAVRHVNAENGTSQKKKRNE